MAYFNALCWTVSWLIVLYMARFFAQHYSGWSFAAAHRGTADIALLAFAFMAIVFLIQDQRAGDKVSRATWICWSGLFGTFFVSGVV